MFAVAAHCHSDSCPDMNLHTTCKQRGACSRDVRNKLHQSSTYFTRRKFPLPSYFLIKLGRLFKLAKPPSNHNPTT